VVRIRPRQEAEKEPVDQTPDEPIRMVDDEIIDPFGD
jgi:hypothetical protein